MPWIVRPEARQAAPVGESWQRIRTCAQSHFPIFAKVLRPGASAKELASFEDAVGMCLPDDVRESYLICDGHAIDDDCIGGIFFGLWHDPLVEDFGHYERCSVLKAWRRDKQWHEEERVSPFGSQPELLSFSDSDGLCTSFPEDAMKKSRTSPGRIPLQTDYRGRHVSVDLDPGPNGVVGQVIIHVGDHDGMQVIAPSWAHFLEDIADEMEAGNFIWYPEQELLFRDPVCGLPHNSWSLAKLPASFQASKPLPLPTVGTVDDSDAARTCATLVQEFITAVNRWERYWLERRPIRVAHCSAVSEAKDRGIVYYGHSSPTPPERSELDRMLRVGEFVDEALRQLQAIASRFCTARSRGPLTAWNQSDPPFRDPERQQVSHVLRVSPDLMLVVVRNQKEEVRFHVVKKEGRWLLDCSDRAINDGTYGKLRLF